jgi:hypothetical protein
VAGRRSAGCASQVGDEVGGLWFEEVESELVGEVLYGKHAPHTVSRCVERW